MGIHILHWKPRLARRVASLTKCAYLYVPGGVGSTIRIRTFAKLQWRRTHVVRPSDGKARIGISNEYLYNILQCIVA
jgi:hypothetical protein